MAMKNNAIRVLSSSGVVFCCLTSIAIAQQPGGGYTTPIITRPDQNVPGAASFRSRLDPATTPEDALPGRTWNIVPRVRLSETFTDNVNLTATDKKSDFITGLAPGVRINANTARLSMFFDYQLVAYIYAKNSEDSNFQNYLNTFGTLEAVDNWLFLDFGGYVTQQTISPFGTQSVSNANNNNNRTQTQTYRLSPYIRGQLGGDVAEYMLRYNAATTRSGNDSISNVDISQWIGQIRGGSPFKNLAWTVDGSQQTTDFSLGRNYDDARLRAILTYQLLPQLRVSGSGGEESNNYITSDTENYTTYGYGLDWRPTDRTIVAGFQEKRFFGYGHNFNLSHRFPLSSIQYTDVKDVAFIPNDYATTGQGALYDQYFELFSNQIPDPVARAAYVNNLLNQSGGGTNVGNTQTVNGYLTNRPQLRRTQQLSLVLYGSRNSVTFRATRISDEVLSVLGGTESPTNPFSKVVQNGYSINFAHRLSPLTSLNVLGLYQTNDAPSSPSLDNTLRMFQVGISSQLGKKTFATLNARRSIYSSDSNPYNENAVSASLIFTF
jgi:uncharacterized protein (PEP-CTERM system associated)